MVEVVAVAAVDNHRNTVALDIRRAVVVPDIQRLLDQVLLLHRQFHLLRQLPDSRNIAWSVEPREKRETRKKRKKN